MGAGDTRRWVTTDMPNERLAFDMPLTGVEVMSARSSERHWRDYHLSFVVAVLPGRADIGAKWRSRSRTHFTGGGGLMLMDPGEQHVTEKVTSPADFDLVRIAPERLSRAAEQLEWKRPLHFLQPSVVDPVVHLALGSFVSAMATRAEPLEVECRFTEAVAAMIPRLMGTEAPVVQSVPGSRLSKVMEYLRTHTEARPTLSELSEMARVSEFALCRAFRRTLRMSPGQYGTVCRLARSRQLLLDGWLAKDIAAELGFADEPHFNRVFKRHYGVPPGVWRDAWRNSSVRRHSVG